MLPITIGPEIYNRAPVNRFARLPASVVPVLQKSSASACTKIKFHSQKLIKCSKWREPDF
jgi:hypothetical protein